MESERVFFVAPMMHLGDASIDVPRIQTSTSFCKALTFQPFWWVKPSEICGLNLSSKYIFLYEYLYIYYLYIYIYMVQAPNPPARWGEWSFFHLGQVSWVHGKATFTCYILSYSNMGENDQHWRFSAPGSRWTTRLKLEWRRPTITCGALA